MTPWRKSGLQSDDRSNSAPVRRFFVVTVAVSSSWFTFWYNLARTPCMYCIPHFRFSCLSSQPYGVLSFFVLFRWFGPECFLCLLCLLSFFGGGLFVFPLHVHFILFLSFFAIFSGLFFFSSLLTYVLHFACFAVGVFVWMRCFVRYKSDKRKKDSKAKAKATGTLKNKKKLFWYGGAVQQRQYFAAMYRLRRYIGKFVGIYIGLANIPMYRDHEPYLYEALTVAFFRVFFLLLVVFFCAYMLSPHARDMGSSGNSVQHKLLRCVAIRLQGNQVGKKIRRGKTQNTV